MYEPLYTPYGFKDRLFDETAEQEILRQKLNQVFRLYGYRQVETPMVEYLDVFGRERGSIAPQDMYKFVDRDGELLVLRPDMTPALARMASASFEEKDLPIRVTSTGATFRYNSRYSAKQRQLKQTGIELYGFSNPFEDAEVLTTAVRAIKSCGTKEYRITFGHAKLIQDLLTALEVPVDEYEKWAQRIESKNIFALEQKTRKMSAAKQKMVQLMMEAGGEELIEQGIRLAMDIHPWDLEMDFRYLKKVYQLVKAYGIEEDILFDPGMRPELGYYTGIIFKGYALGAAEPVLDGGRYDALLEQMGKPWGAIGFGIYQDRLLEALKAQDALPQSPEMEKLTGTEAEALIQEAERKRALGQPVTCNLERQEVRP